MCETRGCGAVVVTVDGAAGVCVLLVTVVSIPSFRVLSRSVVGARVDLIEWELVC